MSRKNHARVLGGRVSIYRRTLGAEHPTTIHAERERREHRLVQAIRECIDTPPSLSREQRERLAAELLEGGGDIGNV